MVKTVSTMLPIGTIAPEFSLINVCSGERYPLHKNKGEKGTVIMFICNHCPYVKHINPALTELANEYMGRGIQFIAINSNDIKTYPDDAPDKMQETADREAYPFPYLFDDTQEVAKAYQAACTPDFYLFDQDLKLVYRGQLDDSRPGNQIPVNGASLSAAMDCLIEGKAPDVEQKPSMGCNIKWKA